MFMYIMKPPKTFSQACKPPSGGGGIADSVVMVERASSCASLSRTPSSLFLVRVSFRTSSSAVAVVVDGRLSSSCSCSSEVSSRAFLLSNGSGFDICAEVEGRLQIPAQRTKQI